MIISPPPLRAPITDAADGSLSRPWLAWFSNAGKLIGTASGTTSQRPTSGLFVGLQYFDVTLNKPIWYGNSGWVDATGAAV